MKQTASAFSGTISMRWFNCLYRPNKFDILWLALMVLVSPVSGQEADIAAPPLVAHSNSVANSIPSAISGQISFQDISAGISIASRLPQRLQAARSIDQKPIPVTKTDRTPSSNARLTAAIVDTKNQSDAPLPVTLVPPAGTDSDHQTSAEPTFSAKENAETIDSSLQDASFYTELLRPVVSVNLAAATRSVSLSGEDLAEPKDQSYRFRPISDPIQDLYPSLGIHIPRRNLHPIWFNPLYFEDANLERCGHHHGLFTEFVSIGRFFGRMPVIPYMMASNPPHSCVRSLGDCPTGSQFGWDAYVPQPNLHGTAMQAAATVGLIFLIP